MNTLNADCLMEIIKLLNIGDQISMYEVSTSVQAAVRSRWLIKFKHTHIDFSRAALSNDKFAVFLKAIEDIVELLVLRFLNKEKYDVLKQFCFKRVRDFRFTLSKPYFLEDDDLKDLVKVMPNLETFFPHGNLTGLYMDQWPLLKHLNITYCFKLEVQQFQTILNRLELEKLILNVFPISKKFEQMNLMDAQLEKLNYLQLNTYELYHFLAKPLPALKELIICNRYNPRQMFDVLLSVWQAKDIRLVETSNVDNILASCFEMHMNVEQLFISKDDNALPSSVIPSLHLFTNMRKLCFKNCSINSKDFCDLLKNIPQLHEISYENCDFDVACISINVQEIFDSRVEKFRLNMYENRLIYDRVASTTTDIDGNVYVVVNLIGNHKLFELTNLQRYDCCYEPLRILYQ